MVTHFSNRQEAGKKLAEALSAYKEREKTVVLAMPRGGVPVAFEVTHALHLPLDLMLVRKLGVPGQEELAMGAIAHGDVHVLNEDVVRHHSIPRSVIKNAIAREKKELSRRNDAYRGGLPAPNLKHCTVILVDDGMATGANMRAAVQAVRKCHAKRVIVAVPVSSASAYALLSEMADEVVCLHVPEPFYGVGDAYRDFDQTQDEEVKELLCQATSPDNHSREVGEDACESA
jgi:predicted phosphoribosyltransferase